MAMTKPKKPKRSPWIKARCGAPDCEDTLGRFQPYEDHDHSGVDMECPICWGRNRIANQFLMFGERLNDGSMVAMQIDD